MIKIIYHRHEHRVTMTGHAESDEFGHDLICAACSMLAKTLAENVKDLEQNNAIENKTVVLESGHAEIACRPVLWYGSIVTMLFDFFCTGFALMAKDYPQFVTMEIQG